MKIILIIIVVLVVLSTGICLWWRSASRRRSLPCPSWLSWILENPIMEVMAGSSLILDRIGLKSGMYVLDVGCGPGRITIPSAMRVGPNGKVVALDIQQAMLKKTEVKAAARGLKNIQIILGGIEQGFLKHNTFDRAILVTVLGEIPERVAALGEIYKTLKPGGIISITEVIPDPHYQSRSTVRLLAEAVGFEMNRQYSSWWAFTMNFVKPQTAEGKD